MIDDGYEIISLYSPQEFAKIKKFALDWITTLFEQNSSSYLDEERLKTYHEWGGKESVPHSLILSAKNRHCSPPENIKEIIVNSSLVEILERLGLSKHSLWDEGLGWLAFRLIRPNHGDGYPFSCKAWGPATKVYSIWLPIVSFSPDVFLKLIPGSHNNTYEKYLPENSKFTKDEYRLVNDPPEHETIRPVVRPGSAIIYHPYTMHTEDILHGNETRFNLEFRVLPHD